MSDTDVSQVLGVGNFGNVYKGRLYGAGVREDVAVKTVNKESDLFALRALLSELKILIYIGRHENIVSLVGAHTSRLGEGKI